MIMENKKAGSISIVLLVVFTLILIVTTLFVMKIRAEEIQDRIYAPYSLERIYSDVELLDFYLNEVMGVVGENATVSEFNVELGKYKDNEGNYFVEELGKAEDMNFEIEFIRYISSDEDLPYRIIYNHKFEYKR